jgi:hypothetical protein
MLKLADMDIIAALGRETPYNEGGPLEVVGTNRHIYYNPLAILTEHQPLEEVVIRIDSYQGKAEIQ